MKLTAEQVAHHRRQEEAERAGRAAQWAYDTRPEAVAEALTLLNAVAAGLRRADMKRPCDDGPWLEACRAIEAISKPESRYDRYLSPVMRFAERFVQYPWTEPRADMIDYAIRFIEVDAMFFRSGYTKRHMANHLRHVVLTEGDVARLEAAFRARVTQGAGLEEFRAYARLAAKLVSEGRMPEFEAWVRETARGAVLNTRNVDPADFYRVLLFNPHLEERQRERVLRGKYGVVWPELTELVPMRGVAKDEAQKIKRNAYRFESATERRLLSMRKK